MGNRQMWEILVLDDNETYSNQIAKHLIAAGYQVDISNDPMEAIVMVGQKKYDLIISDLIMDTANGLQFLGAVKKIHPKMKSIILTGMPTVETEMQSLDIDVDQYLQKDIRIDLLLKYVERILNKEDSKKEIILYSKAENIECHIAPRTVVHNGEEISIRRKEFDILSYFLENKNVVITRKELIDTFWETHYELVDERVIDVHIKELRRKLQIQSIVSIRGYGYKWDE